MRYVQSVFTYAVSAYKMMTDRGILQAPISATSPRISFEQASQVAGVLKDMPSVINLLSSNVWSDDRNLSRAVYTMIVLFNDYGRLNESSYDYLDAAYLEYLDYMDTDSYEDYPDEWRKVLYIIRRHKGLLDK